MTLPIIYGLSFGLLLFTKAADVVSTIRWVHPSAEMNPWACRFFGRFGFKCGLLIASAVYLAVAVVQQVAVWWYCATWAQAANAAVGFIISGIQWVVARCNATGKPIS